MVVIGAMLLKKYCIGSTCSVVTVVEVDDPVVAKM